MKTMELFAYILFTVFGVIGLFETVRFLSFKLYRPKQKVEQLLLCPLDGGVDDVELLIRFLHHQAKWDCYESDIVLLLDRGLDAEGQRIAKVLAQDLDGVVYCTEETLLKQLPVKKE